MRKLCLNSTIFVMILISIFNTYYISNVKHELGKTKAVYLVSKDGGALSSADLIKHPEVIVVNDFNDLKKLADSNFAIWIDKGSAKNVDVKWLSEEPQKYYPIVMVGCNDALYSFSEILNIGDIEGPKIDWTNQKISNGFSIWKLIKTSSDEKSTYLKGYDISPTVNNILFATNLLH